MRLWIRRVIVALFAFGFAAGGFARATLALAPGQPCHAHHQDAGHSAHLHAGHDGHAEHQQQDAGHQQQDDGGYGAPIEHACFKCCGVCTAAPNLPDARASAAVGLIGYSVAYFVASQSYQDRPLVIDPGIPKRMA